MKQIAQVYRKLKTYIKKHRGKLVALKRDLSENKYSPEGLELKFLECYKSIFKAVYGKEPEKGTDTQHGILITLLTWFGILASMIPILKKMKSEFEKHGRLFPEDKFETLKRNLKEKFGKLFIKTFLGSIGVVLFMCGLVATWYYIPKQKTTNREILLITLLWVVLDLLEVFISKGFSIEKVKDHLVGILKRGAILAITLKVFTELHYRAYDNTDFRKKVIKAVFTLFVVLVFVLNAITKET